MIKKFFLALILFIPLATETLPFSTDVSGSEREFTPFLTPSAYLTSVKRFYEFTPEELNLLKETRIIRVVVKASSWLGVPIDIGKVIRIKLEAVGFLTISEEKNDYDATMFVDYTEVKGNEYGILGSGSNGTDIRCVIRIDHNKVGTVFERNFTTWTSYPSVKCPSFSSINECLRGDAFKHLENTPGFQDLAQDIRKELRGLSPMSPL